MIPVIWYNQCRGNWDHGTLLSIFEKHPDYFPQYNSKELVSCYNDKVIVIVSGKPDVDDLRDYLQNSFGPLGGIVILTSEEDAYFEWKLAIPSKFEVWTQYYSPSTKSDIKTRLLLGPPLRIKDYKINKHLPRKYIWSFVGQVQNPFRQECMDALKFWGTRYSFLQEVEMFGGNGANGIEYQEYLDIMCQSRYVICPPGSMCVDSFRLYEAIACGAIPITNKRSPRDQEGLNYWDEVYPNHGILTVDNWKDIGSLIFDLENNHIKVDRDGLWYEQYLKDLEKKLLNVAKLR
jgi:hypothetical protein